MDRKKKGGGKLDRTIHYKTSTSQPKIGSNHKFVLVLAPRPPQIVCSICANIVEHSTYAADTVIK